MGAVNSSDFVALMVP